MDSNKEKEIIYLEDKINYLKRKKEKLDAELRFSTLEVKKLTDNKKRGNKSNPVLIAILGSISANFIINGSILVGILFLIGSGSIILTKFFKQDKISNLVIQKLENNMKTLMELETICDDINEYSLKLKQLKNSDIKEEVSITRGVLNEYITKKEEINKIKIKKIGGNFGKNI